MNCRVLIEQVSLELAYTEDEIYELSLAREPRDSLSVRQMHNVQLNC